MKTFFSLMAFIMMLSISITVFGDGISVTKDLKHVRGRHTTIKLNKDQVFDVEQKRKIVLTETQIKPLRAIYDKVPMKLPVLSSRYDLCTCDMGAYAVWCRVGEIDIPHSSIKDQKIQDEEEEEYNRMNPSPPVVESSEHNKRAPIKKIHKFLIIDSKGQMFEKGKVISENELLSIIDNISRKELAGDKDFAFISFDLPPPVSKDVDKRIFDLLRRIKSHCYGKRIFFSAMGFRNDH